MSGTIDYRGPEEEGREAIPPEVQQAMADPRKRLDQYILVNPLGAGGMGMVVRAWDEKLSRWAAIKFLKAIGDDDAEKRFDREARLAAKLSHPNIAAIYQIGRHENAPYIAMQFVDGQNLWEARRSLKREEIVRVMRDAANAVHAAHEMGIVHRDLKPANLMIDREGRLFVTDFGLAKESEVEGREGASAPSSVIMGTPEYMPPEQARGNVDAVDAVSDVYSLGACLYELLTGRPPFQSESRGEVIAQVLREEALPPRRFVQGLPRDLDTITLKCLEKEKPRRYATAKALAEDLKRYAEGDPIEAHPPSLAYRVSRKIRKHRALSAAVALLVVTVLAALGVFFGPGTVDIEAPPNAVVHIDGPPPGGMRFRVWPPRTVRVRLEAPDRQPVETELVVAPWKTTSWAPELLSDHGFVTVRSTPPGARVMISVSGKEIVAGTTPIDRFRLPVGTHRVTLSVDAHEPVSDAVEVGPDVEARIEKSLRHFEGRLSVSTDDEGYRLRLLGPKGEVVNTPLPIRDLAVPTGEYRMRIEKENHFPVDRQIDLRRDKPLSTHASLPPMSAWSMDVGGGSRSAPAVGDLNEDGVLDVVVGTGGRGLVAVSGDGGGILWTVDTPYPVGASPLIIDANNDGQLDVVIEIDDILQVFSGREGRRIWSGPESDVGLRAGATFACAAAADLDGDGRPEIIHGDDSNRILALRGIDGSPLWTFETEKWVTAAPALADLNGDTRPDVVIGSWDGKLRAISGSDGTLLWEFETGDSISAAAVLVKLDGDDVPDVLLGGDRLRALSGKDGRLLWEDEKVFCYLPSLLSIDSDAIPDVVVAGDGGLRALSGSNGGELWSQEISGSMDRGCAIGDVDGDGREEIVVGNSDGRLLVLDGKTGALVRTFHTPGAIEAAPALADLDLDGRLEAVFVSNDGKLHAVHVAASREDWTVVLDEPVTAPAIALDVDQDGIQDVVVGGEDGFVRAHSGGNGTLLWETDFGPIRDPLGLADLNGDGLKDIMVVMGRSLGIFNGQDGKLLWRKDLGGQCQTPPAASDLNGDGTPDIVVTVAMGGGFLALSGKDGAELWKYEKSDMIVESRAHFFDFDQDGTDDVIACSGAAVVAFSGKTGEVILFRDAEGIILDSPAVGDLNRDGWPDIVVGTANGSVVAFSPIEEEPLWKFEYLGTSPGEPVIRDVSHDDIPDVLVGTHGTFYALDGRDGRPLWSYRTGGWSGDPAALIQLDPDPVPDVLINGGDGRVHALAGINGRVLWTFAPGAEYLSGPILTGNILQAVVGTSDWRVIAFNTGYSGLGSVWSASLSRDPAGRTRAEWVTSLTEMGGDREAGDAWSVKEIATAILQGDPPASVRRRLLYFAAEAAGRQGDLEALKPLLAKCRETGLRGTRLAALGLFLSGATPEGLVAAVTGDPMQFWDSLLHLRLDPVQFKGLARSAVDLLGSDDLVARSVLLMMANRKPDAVEALEKEASRAPYDPTILHFLARLYTENMDYDLAIETYDRLLKLRPGWRRIERERGVLPTGSSDWLEAATQKWQAFDVRAALRMARKAEETARRRDRVTWLYPALVAQCLNTLGRYADAAEAFKRSLLLKPEPEEMHNKFIGYLGEVRVKAGLYADALEPLNRILGLEPDRLEAYHYRARAFEGLGKLDEAMKDAEHVLGNEPNRSESLALRARLHRKLGHAAEAERDVRRALQINEEDYEALLEFAVQKEAAGNLDFAISLVSAAIDVYPGFIKARLTRARWLRRIGRDTLLGNDLDFVLQWHPDHVETLLLRGRFRLDKWDLEGALSDFNRIIRGKSPSAEAWFLRGMARFRKGDLEMALSDMKEATRVDPAYADAHEQRASWLFGMERSAEAVEDINRAIEIKPTKNRHLVRSYIHAALEKHEEARADAEAGLALQPPGPLDRDLLNQRAVYGMRLGKWAEAAEDLTRAIELDPGWPFAILNRGLAWKKRAEAATGEEREAFYDKAVEDWEKFLKMQPEGQEAAAVREKLEEIREARNEERK